MRESLILTVTHFAYSRIINNQFTLPVQDTHETTTKIYAPVNLTNHEIKSLPGYHLYLVLTCPSLIIYNDMVTQSQMALETV